MPKSDGWFKKGNPGRLPGTEGGRKKALRELDKLIAKEGNLRKLVEKWQELFDRNPAAFFMKVVMPLVPKEFILQHGGEVKAALRVIMSNGHDKNGGDGDASGDDDTEC